MSRALREGVQRLEVGLVDLGGGRMLGPVGGRIVAEVLIGLLAFDPLSFLNVEPGWHPVAPFARDDGTFDMPQLIRIALQP